MRAMGEGATTRTIEANGLSFEVDEYPAADGGTERLALCLHGFPESKFSWRFQGPLLAKLGWRVWAPNQRGYGKSSRPKGVAAYDIDHLVAAVAQGQVHPDFEGSDVLDFINGAVVTHITGIGLAGD